MHILTLIDRTVSKPIESVDVFDDEAALLEYLGFDANRCIQDEDEDGNNDAPCNFDEDEIAQLLTNMVVYRDKREIYQLLVIEDGKPRI
jgi:hypothetical protein